MCSRVSYFPHIQPLYCFLNFLTIPLCFVCVCVIKVLYEVKLLMFVFSRFAASLGSWISVMSHFCLHNLTLLDSVAGIPACVWMRECVWESESKERESKVRARARGREGDPRRTGFLQGLWLFLHHYPDCRQSLLMSLFPLPIHTITCTHIQSHTYTILYVSTKTEGACTGEKRGNMRD